MVVYGASPARVEIEDAEVGEVSRFNRDRDSELGGHDLSCSCHDEIVGAVS